MDEKLITLFAGVVNPAIIEYCIRTYFIFLRDKKLSEDEIEWAKMTIRSIVLIITSSLLVGLFIYSGAIKDAIEIVYIFVQFVFTSQGSYDLIYKPIGEKKEIGLNRI